jgi:hypothetical protein
LSVWSDSNRDFSRSCLKDLAKTGKIVIITMEMIMELVWVI